METYGLDTGTIVVAAAAFLVACIALRSWLRTPKSQNAPEAELLVQIRDELRTANAALAQLKTSGQQQQSALEKTAETLKAMRRSADDHASDVKSCIEGLSGVVDAARAEATGRHEAMDKRINEVRDAAVDAREKATDAFMAAGGQRKQIEMVVQQINAVPHLLAGIENLQQGMAAIAGSAGAIPELRAGIDGLRQDVAAVAEAMPKKTAPAGATPDKPAPPAPKKRERRTPQRGRGRGKEAAKAATEETPPSAGAQPSGSAGTGGAGKPAEAAPPAAAAPDAGSAETNKPEEAPAGGEGAPKGQEAASPAETPGKAGPDTKSDTADATAGDGTGTDGEPARQAHEAAGDKSPGTRTNGGAAEAAAADGNRAPAQTGDKAGQAPPAGPGRAGAGQQTQAAR